MHTILSSVLSPQGEMEARQDNFSEAEAFGKQMKDADHYASAEIDETVSIGQNKILPHMVYYPELLA